MTFFRRCCLCVMFYALCSHSLFAQEKETMQLFQEERMDSLVRYTMSPEQMKKYLYLDLYTANAREDLTTIGMKLEDSPYVIIKRVSFLEGVKAINGLQSKIVEYRNLDKAYQDLQKIDSQRSEVFRTILKEQKNRSELFISANAQLNEQIEELDEQFKAASMTSKKAIRGRTFKAWRMGIVGGIIGLSAGVLFGALRTN